MIVRDATETDLAGLGQVNYAQTPALHRDRLRDATRYQTRYLVVEQGAIAGYALLVFERPPHWSDADDRSHLPQIVDLYVRPDLRGQGIGSFFIGQLETLAARAGHTHLYAAVDPVDNLRAHQWYLRLGFVALEAEPHRVHWHFTDSDGTRHEGDEWSLNLVRQLSAAK